MNKRHLNRSMQFLLGGTVLASWLALGQVQEIRPLPGTKPLSWQGNLDERMMEGAHRFVEQEIAEAARNRERFWKRDLSSPANYEKSVEPNRAHLRTMIGAVEKRLPVVMERFGDDKNPALVAENEDFAIYQVRWPVLDYVWGEGLLVEPRKTPRGHLVLIADADQTPEQALELSRGEGPTLARALATAGFQIIVPVLVSREQHITNIPWDRSNQSNREWIYRQAFHMGRHLIGFEVEKVLACVEWFEKRHGSRVKIGLAGYGEGGLIAFYAAALDTRVDATLISGYFGPREATWAEPLDRNIFGLLREFGDAELGALIAPRTLVVEYSSVPAVSGRKGTLTTPPFELVKAEFDRIDQLTGPKFGERHLVAGGEGRAVARGSGESLAHFARALDPSTPVAAFSQLAGPLRDRRQPFDPAARQNRQLKGLEDYVQHLVRQSPAVRQQFFLHKAVPELADRTWNTEYEFPSLPPQKLIEQTKWYRNYFHEELMGKFDETMLEPNPRTRRIYDREHWVGYDVVLDVYPDVFAWGVLLVPKDIQPGEKRPVVVCQHGANGLPQETIEENGVYRSFAARLADRGFVVFAPHNLYRGSAQDKYRWLDRKANTIKATLYSFLIAQHDQITRWLASLPFVDPERIGFYGLSFGGESALQIPAVIERYCLSIAAGFFTQYTHKVASTYQVSPTDRPSSWMYTGEWERPYFNLGMTFDHSEMVYLIFPRPFMVERGMHDWVSHDHWVAHEYAKVRWLYTQLGLGDRTEIEFFNGGHTIRGQGAFDFLHKHLNWPKRVGITP